MPSQLSQEMAEKYLIEEGFDSVQHKFYVAPMYSGSGPINDANLLEWLNLVQPDQIILCLGGGTQERLGYFLKRNLNLVAGIHCIGAAIGFLSGEQARIPTFVDWLYIGWLHRCISKPSIFIPRYFYSIRLFYLIVRYGSRPLGG